MNTIVRNVAFCPACKRECGANHKDDCVLTPQGATARDEQQAKQPTSKDVRKGPPPGIFA